MLPFPRVAQEALSNHLLIVASSINDICIPSTHCHQLLVEQKDFFCIICDCFRFTRIRRSTKIPSLGSNELESVPLISCGGSDFASILLTWVDIDCDDGSIDMSFRNGDMSDANRDCFILSDEDER